MPIMVIYFILLLFMAVSEEASAQDSFFFGFRGVVSDNKCRRCLEQGGPDPRFQGNRARDQRENPRQNSPYPQEDPYNRNVSPRYPFDCLGRPCPPTIAR